jgi:hypothetical protein
MPVGRSGEFAREGGADEFSRENLPERLTPAFHRAHELFLGGDRAHPRRFRSIGGDVIAGVDQRQPFFSRRAHCFFPGPFFLERFSGHRCRAQPGSSAMLRQVRRSTARRMPRRCRGSRRNSQFQKAGGGRHSELVRSRVPGKPSLGMNESGGFWGEQPGAGGTAHFGTVARPTSYYGFWEAKFAGFFCGRRVRLNE